MSQANAYQIMVGPENFLDPGFNASEYYKFGAASASIISQAIELRGDIITTGKYEMFRAADCTNLYLHQYMSRYGNVLLIQSGEELSPDVFQAYYPDHRESSSDWRSAYDSTAKPSETNDPSAWAVGFDSYDDHGRDRFSGVYPYDGSINEISLPLRSDPRSSPSYYWQCLTLTPFEEEGYCNATTLHESVGPYGHEWAPFGSPVKHCWAETVEEACSLKVDLFIGTGVISANLLKVCCMYLTWTSTQRAGLMTIGDAASAFVDEPDHNTKGLCGYSKSEIELLWDVDKTRSTFLEPTLQRSSKQRSRHLKGTWKPSAQRWWRAVSPIWYGSYVL